MIRQLILMPVVVVIAYCALLGPSHGARMNSNDLTDSRMIRVPLQQYGDFSRSRRDVHLEFSLKGDNICLWWSTEVVNKWFPSRWLILKADGSMLCSSDVPSSDAEHCVHKIPLLSGWAWSKQYLANVDSYSVDETQSILVRATTSSHSFPRSCRIEAISLASNGGEVWTKEVLPCQGVALLGFFEVERQRRLFVGFEGTEARILDPTNGDTIGNLTYGHIESDREAVSRKKRFGLGYSDNDVALKFYSTVLSIDKRKQRIVVGAFHDRRVRVISLIPPFPVIFEAHTNENPQEPRGGTWQVYWADFVASGKYLVVEYFFGGRGTDIVLRPTEVYETEHWQKVWEADGTTIHSVTLSPDGKNIAFIRDNVLEIGPFIPKTQY